MRFAARRWHILRAADIVCFRLCRRCRNNLNSPRGRRGQPLERSWPQSTLPLARLKPHDLRRKAPAPALPPPARMPRSRSPRARAPQDGRDITTRAEAPPSDAHAGASIWRGYPGAPAADDSLGVLRWCMRAATPSTFAHANWSPAERSAAFAGALSLCLGPRLTPSVLASAARLADDAVALSSDAAAQAAQRALENARPRSDEPSSSEDGCESA